MVNLYITLIKIAHELNRNLAGGRVTGLVSFRKNEFYLLFGQKGAIGIFLYPSKPLLFFQNQVSVPGRNVVNLFDELSGKTMESVNIHTQDRLIRLVFSNDYELVIQLFSASSGMTLYHKGVESESIRKNSGWVDSTFWTEISAASANPSVLQTALDSVHRFLKSPINPTGMPSDSLTDPVYRIYTNGIRRFLSPIELTGFELLSESGNGSIAIKYFILESIQADQFNKEKSELIRNLSGRLIQIKQTIQRLNTWLENGKPGEKDEVTGHLLSSYANQAEKGQDSVLIDNWINGSGEKVTIALNPLKSIRENAEAYYERSKRQKATHREKTEVLYHQQKIGKHIERLLDEARNAEIRKDLLLIKNQFPSVTIKATGEDTLSEPIFRFLSKYGHEILVGKHARGNDYLLSKLAGKNDIWFHIRGDSGSHVLIPNKKPVYPSKQVLEEAAGLAAAYSKQKKSEWVPVSYTFVKYVRKPKGAAAGAVIIEREEVIFVKPSTTNSN